MTRTPAQERYEDIYDSKRDLTPFEEAFLATYSAISQRASRTKGIIWNEEGLRGEDYRIACLVVERLKDDDQAKALAALDAEPIVSAPAPVHVTATPHAITIDLSKCGSWDQIDKGLRLATMMAGGAA